MERNDELMHYGIPGMKWGHRKAAPTTSVDRARANYRAARKTYNRSFNKAYNRSLAAYSPSKKQRKANDARWDKAANDAKRLKEAKSVYKAEKKYSKDLNKYQKAKGLQAASKHVSNTYNKPGVNSVTRANNAVKAAKYQKKADKLIGSISKESMSRIKSEEKKSTNRKSQEIY